MDKKFIKQKLNTNILGNNIILLDKIDSTQDEAKRIENIKNGTIIIAEEQTRAKGTHGRKWYTNLAYKNIAMTFVLFPNVNISKFQNITIIIAECLVKTFKKLYNIQLEIKYPNDIISSNKKIGGILTETKVIGECVKELYVGIGLNILQTEFNKEIVDIASSILNEFHIECCREEIIAEFLNIFEKEYTKLMEE